jgi:hypothetical protein
LKIMNVNELNERFIPKVAAKLSKDSRTFEILCPYCGEIHTHGAGVDGKLYGHRLSHCVSRTECNAGYYLVKATKFFKV